MSGLVAGPHATLMRSAVTDNRVVLSGGTTDESGSVNFAGTILGGLLLALRASRIDLIE